MLTSTVTGMLILIFDSRTAAEGIRLGIDICLQTLIPSLFPFFVTSGILISFLFGQPIPFLSAVGKFCHIPVGCESLLAIGFLGGYPVGAATVYSIHTEGKLTAEEANRMAIFCNNAGPSFLFGILGPMFPNLSYVWCLWMIQVVSALLTAYILGDSQRGLCMVPNKQISLNDALNRAIRNIATVCGWVILFRMILEFFDRWFLWLLHPAARTLLTGVLELSNGCLLLQNVDNLTIRFLLASMMLSIGGLCILMQTHAVFPELNIRQYMAGKVLHLFLTLILSMTAVLLMRGDVLHSFFCLTALILGISALRAGCRKSKIAVAFP